MQIAMSSCPECGSEKLAWKNVGRVCSECGLVTEAAYFSGGKVV